MRSKPCQGLRLCVYWRPSLRQNVRVSLFQTRHSKRPSNVPDLRQNVKVSLFQTRYSKRRPKRRQKRRQNGESICFRQTSFPSARTSPERERISVTDRLLFLSARTTRLRQSITHRLSSLTPKNLQGIPRGAGFRHFQSVPSLLDLAYFKGGVAFHSQVLSLCPPSLFVKKGPQI